MSTKLGKCEFPSGHGPSDFKAFGPTATKDGQFDGVCLVDMGCFTQDGKDSNKYYHAAVVQSTKNNKWYTYFEYARVGAEHPQHQMIECSSKEEAMEELASQCHSKNDKRGVWKTIAGLPCTLVAKPGKDVYKVQSLASRTTGLPDAKNITSNAGLKEEKLKKTESSTKFVKKIDIDPQTSSLLRDLRVGTISYARTSLEGGNIPTQAAIDEARDVLDAALKRLGTVGNDAKDQVKDSQIKQLTYHLYSRIPKKKALRADEATWILSRDTIPVWQSDLDAFENAIYANTEVEAPEENPYGDLPIAMEYLPPNSELGKFVYDWMPKATANKHYNLGSLRIKNLWKVTRFGDADIFNRGQERCRITSVNERALFQPANRPDLDREQLKKYAASNSALLFHGTRSVNVSGILRTMLRQPKDLGAGVVITGAMFSSQSLGYFADDFKKSAGYTSLQNSYWSGGAGGVGNRSAFMFLMDCVLGKPFVAPRPHPYNSPPQGHHCIFGKAGYSQVQNNEWVLFHRDQTQIRYLVEFDISSK